MIIDGTAFKPKVTAPENAEILEMNEKQLRDILSYRVHQGEKAHKAGSTFIGFAAKVHSINDVVTAYRQLRYRFMEVASIMCTYRIMDPDVAHMQDSIDNEEYGAGRRLLQMLIDNSVKNKAVFVIRKFKGQHIGPIRFNMIVDVAKSAIDTMPEDIESILCYDLPGNNSGYSQFNRPKIPINNKGQRIRGSLATPRQLRQPNTTPVSRETYSKVVSENNSSRKVPLQYVRV